MDDPLPVSCEEVSDISRIVRLPDSVVVDGQGVLLRRPDDHGGVQLVRDVERDLVSGNWHRYDLEKMNISRFYLKSNSQIDVDIKLGQISHQIVL